MEEPSQLKCGFSVLIKSDTHKCGLMKKQYKNDVSVIPLKNCKKEIQTHLSRMDLSKRHANQIPTEWSLIALRAGIFDLDSPLLDTTVCPVHRYKLGLLWFRPRKCCHPLHDLKRKPQKEAGGVHRSMSEEIFNKWGVLVPIGSGICRPCKTSHQQAMTTEPEPCPAPRSVPSQHAHLLVGHDIPPDLPEVHSHHESVIPPEGGAQDDQSPTKISGTSDNGSSSESDRVIQGGQFVVGSGSSTPSSESYGNGYNPLDVTWAPTPAPTNVELGVLNRFLVQGGCAPVDGQLHTSIDAASNRTIRYYKMKTKEAFGLVLHLLAPGQEDELMALVQSRPSLIDDSLAESVIRCYEEAKTWYTKRQILSVLATNRTKAQLLELIPGLTVYRIDQARQHTIDVGQAQPVSHEPITRSRLDEVKVDHFLDFISRPDFIQDVAYGTRTLKLSHGEKLEIPNIVRTTIVSRLIQLYFAYCEEVKFQPLQRSTLFSIIQVCAASQKKSLAGLDNIAADGAQAFDTLISVVDELGNCGYPKASIDVVKSKIQSARLYLRTDYKLDVCEESRCPDHCITFALADGAPQCTHEHDLGCERCDEVSSIFDMIESAIGNTELVYRYEKQREELQYDFEAAKEKVLQLKSHLLRAKNQERAKTKLLSDLLPHQALLTMDWAMKFLPSKFREAQQDWFAKKGISWHVSAVVSKSAGDEYQIHCFVHVVDQCRQDWFAVLSLIEANLIKLQVELPHIEEVFLRSDNAGCYHNASLILSLPALSKSKGIVIKRYDFSEAQAGKDICDRKIAPMKSHIQKYINEGHNVENAQDMRAAMDTYGGVKGCHVAVVSLKTVTAERASWPGITSFTNFEFEEEGVRVWKGYGIGPGTLFSYDRLLKKKQQGPSGVSVGEYTKPRVGTGSMQSSASACPIIEIACPELGCNKTFSTQEALTMHMGCGQHTCNPLKDSKMDRIKRKWAGRVESSGTTTTGSSSIAQGELRESPETVLAPGWAHRGHKAARRYSKGVKEFLEKEFMKGVTSGIKENPKNVAKRLKAAFSKDDWLTPQQIMSFFSRLSTRQKCGHLPGAGAAVVPDDDDEVDEIADVAVTRCRLRARIMSDA